MGSGEASTNYALIMVLGIGYISDSTEIRLSFFYAADLFLTALRNVAEAHGIKKLAEDTQLNRESMYRMLSEQGNPQLSSLTAILK